MYTTEKQNFFNLVLQDLSLLKFVKKPEVGKYYHYNICFFINKIIYNIGIHKRTRKSFNMNFVFMQMTIFDLNFAIACQYFKTVPK